MKINEYKKYIVWRNAHIKRSAWRFFMDNGIYPKFIRKKNGYAWAVRVVNHGGRRQKVSSDLMYNERTIAGQVVKYAKTQIEKRVMSLLQAKKEALQVCIDYLKKEL